MLSFKPKQFSYKEIEKNIIELEFNKKYLLNSEKLKENIYTPSRIPSCISTSQEYQIETNKVPKTNSSDKHNQSKGNFIIFKDYNNKNSVSTKKVNNNKNNVKKVVSLDKIDKNNIKVNDNKIKNDKNNKILNGSNNVKKEMNEIVQNFIDNNLQNNKNFNFFRLFKMKRKNQNYNEKEIFPPLYGNVKPVETEQNAIDKNDNKYINLLTKQNEDNIIHYRDTLINSVNKKKLKDNKIFIKIDEHFNKLKKDKSPKIIKKDFQGIIKNIKSNNINNLINISANGKNINKINNNIISKQNGKSLPHEKFLSYKNSIEKSPFKNENNKSLKNEEKQKYLYNIKKKNRLKIKLNTPNSNNIYANKEEFNLKNKKKINRKNTPNIFVNNNNIINNIDINNNKNNKINFEFDTKIKNKKIEKVEDNILGDSFRDELNIIISDVNNCKKDNNMMITKENHQDYSIECVDDIKINLNEINYNDDSIEKNIPKEQEERINLIKKYNRPETSYGKQKNISKN